MDRTTQLVYETAKHLSHRKEKKFTSYQIAPRSIQLLTHTSDWCLMPGSRVITALDKLAKMGLITYEREGEGDKLRIYHRLVIK